MTCVLRITDGEIQFLPTSIHEFDNGAQGTVGDDALGAAANGFYHRGLLSVPSTEGTESEGVSHPQHIVAITFSLLFLRGIELRLLQFQALLELTIEIDGLALVEVDADAIEFAFEFHPVMVQDMIGIGAVATGRDGFQEVVVLVFFLYLTISYEQVCIDTGRILTGLALGIEGHRVWLLLLRLQVCQETEFIEVVILIHVVELAGDFFIASLDECRLYLTIFGEINHHRLVGTGRICGVLYCNMDGLLRHRC